MNGGIYAQSAHQPLILFHTHLPKFFRSAGPLMSSVLKSLVQKKESISFPQKSFDSIRFSSAEQKQASFIKWIQLIMILYFICQSVYSASQIRISAGNVYFLETARIFKHWILPSGFLSETHLRCRHSVLWKDLLCGLLHSRNVRIPDIRFGR